MSGADEEWADGDPGPLVRPYTLTQGRTRTNGTVDLVALVTATGIVPPITSGLGPEHQTILRLCQHMPLSVAELSAHMHVPLGAVRVLLGDLHAQHLVQISEAAPDALNTPMLEAVLAGLRRL
ncbi:DUF742 domain-containing protein [Dactylosporangium darangshiense]|uniref:DUF742 domain-containing protein n=1 Tax=Dactylosporangium darangshiense TaxID=579108 RepID=A0ABP8DR54_9ACTN